MILADPRFEIDVTEKRPRLLVPPSVPSPPPIRKRRNHIEAPQTSDFFSGLLVAMTPGRRRLTRPPFWGCRRLWAAAHIRDFHAERRRQVDLMILLLRESLADLVGEAPSRR
jgi:hypothetical protein